MPTESLEHLLPDLVAALRQGSNVVLHAPPGAGKTTGVPVALLDSGVARAKEILVLEPRRIAAQLAARWVAGERGERVGESVGYQVRFDQAVGPKTRVKYLTEALLIRMLLTDKQLRHGGVVIFDEFHERSLWSDLGLALLRRLQQTTRPDLRLVVMSATLAAESITTLLQPSVYLRAVGRAHEVDVEHAATQDMRPLERQVESAVGRVLRDEPSGDVLVFLPGMADIRRANKVCQGLAQRHGALLLPLHGGLSASEQERAVRPAERRKIILSTNVAETSVTIDGVVAVVDSGLARIAGHNPWSGIGTLTTKAISQASATQRAGRAGRTGPGRCLRLYTKHDHDTRRPFLAPEIERLELAEMLLVVRGLGGQLSGLPLPTPAPEAAVDSAHRLLQSLGACAEDGSLTELGARMLELPLHPRQARIAIAAQDRGVTEAGCLVAALLGEGSPRRHGEQAAHSGPSDVLSLSEAFHTAERARFGRDFCASLGLSAGALRSVAKSRDQLWRRLRPGSRRQGPVVEGDQDERALLECVLAGYPDRVGQRRSMTARPGESPEVLLSGGGSARLSLCSEVRDAPWLVVVDAQQSSTGRASQLMIHSASSILPEWLVDLFPERVQEVDELTWNADAERVEQLAQLRYGALELTGARRPATPSPRATALLHRAAAAAGWRRFVPADSVDTLRVRLRLLAEAAPELGLPTFDEAEVDATLEALCENCTSFQQLHGAGLLGALQARLAPEQRQRLEAWMPEQVVLPGGRKLRIHYHPDKPPWVASWLQDFFGLRDGPQIAQGRVTLTLHLLAPNRRAVQVTTDLSGFWERHYPTLRRSLSRRYPRHLWPEDPESAKPPPPSGKRRRQPPR